MIENLIVAPDAYTIAEEIGRDKVINLFDKYELTKSEYKYESFDLSGTTQVGLTEESKPFFIEVKDRTFKSTEYDTAFMEYLKFSHLRLLANEYNGDIFYVSLYKDGVAYVFNLKNIVLTDVYIKLERVKKTTVEDSEYVDKLMIELPLAKGKKYIIK